MKLDLTTNDLALLKMMLSKEEVETRVEIHHSKTFDYRDYLKRREEQIHGLLEQVERLMSGETSENSSPTLNRLNI